MNSLTLYHQALTIFGLLGASICSATLLLIFLRGPLLAALERLHAAKRLTQLVVLLAFAFATLFGGAKHGSPTNDPPASLSGDATNETSIVEGSPAGATGVSSVAGSLPEPFAAQPVLTASRPRLALSAPPQQAESDLLCSPSPSTFTSISAWNTRGAYCDWHRVEFPSSFAFPHGTNLLSGVTVLAYGEIRVTLHSTPTPSLYTLPTRVSLEPDASSFAHGLTPSNSYLFAWSNVCVNRCPTNRIDASIELFPSGVCSVRFGASQTDYPPTLPPGFVGSGQDTNWLASVFSPTDCSQIAEKGYDAWLDDDYVGFNEQNGHFRADITVASLPDSGAPCYLVCGPYKVVVCQPGTYSFPLEVFRSYKVRTYPVALPLSISTDDGYRAPLLSASSPSPVLTASRPRLALAAPSPDTPPEYEICETPRLVLSPSRISLSQAAGTVISIWCNITEGASRLYSSLSGLTTVSFTCPSEAEIEESMVEDAVEFILETSNGSCSGVVYIEDDHCENDNPSYHWCCWWCCGDSCRCDGTCCPCNCGCRSETNGDPPSVTP